MALAKGWLLLATPLIAPITPLFILSVCSRNSLRKASKSGNLSSVFSQDCRHFLLQRFVFFLLTFHCLVCLLGTMLLERTTRFHMSHLLSMKAFEWGNLHGFFIIGIQSWRTHHVFRRSRAHLVKRGSACLTFFSEVPFLTTSKTFVVSAISTL